MNPKPLASLNHFPVPVATADSLAPGTRGPRPAVRTTITRRRVRSGRETPEHESSREPRVRGCVAYALFCRRGSDDQKFAPPPPRRSRTCFDTDLYPTTQAESRHAPITT